MPEHLWIQSDNTTAQAKNSETSKFLAWLVAKYRFQSCSLNFLPVGHTHEDIDQLFGILLGLVLRRTCFQRPAELRDAIQAAMNPIIDSRGEELGVHLLTHIRDFNDWLKPLGQQGCRYYKRSGPRDIQ